MSRYRNLCDYLCGSRSYRPWPLPHLTGLKPKTASGIEKYGRRWKVAQPALIDLICYARRNDPVLIEGMGKHWQTPDVHFIRAIEALYTPDQFRLNPWSIRIIEEWCNTPILAVWGCSGSGKSTTMGMIALLDCMAAPEVTYTCLVTSPAKEHPNRTWGNVVRYYSLLPDILKFGQIKQVPLGLHTAGNENKRAGIHCYSTEPGESTEDFKKRVGAHQKRNRFLVDEAQKCSPSILSAFTNLGSVGEYKEAFIFNPDSWFSAAGKVSIPKPPLTIKKIEEDEPDRWELSRSFRDKHGVCIVLDGARSPALEDDSLAGMLIDRAHLKTIADNSGEDSFEYWSQGRGRMPPEGAVETFCTRRDLEDGNALGDADLNIFTGSFRDLAGLDPSEGRDDAFSIQIRVGDCRDGQTRIAIVKKEQIQIGIKKGDVSGQISSAFTANLRLWNVPILDAALDATGGAAQGDRIEQDIGQRGIHRVMWQGPASKRPASFSNQKAQDIYYDRATELFANVASLARQGRLIGIDDVIAYQLTTRRKIIQAGKSRVEPKDDWRDRNEGKSPNDLDSLICAVELAIHRNLIKPYLAVSRPANQPFQPFSPHGLKTKNQTSAFAERVRRASLLAGKR